MNRAAAAPAKRAASSGRLELRFARAPDGRSYLDHQYADYPFHICRAQYVEGDEDGMATLYTQSSSGGLYEHDRLTLAIETTPDARAHVTSQASTIVHSMKDGEAWHEAAVSAGTGSFLEYMPDPVILFPRARLRTRLAVTLGERATAIVSDSFLPHDPGGEAAPFGFIESVTDIRDSDGALLARDRFKVGGDDFARHRRGVNGAFTAHGALALLRRGEDTRELIDPLRAALESADGIYGGVSALPNGCGLWLRLLAADGAALRAGMFAAWSAMRTDLFGRAPTPRRK